MPNIPSTDCIDLFCGSEESVAVCLVYHSHRALADSLPSLMEQAGLLVLSNISLYADASSKQQSMDFSSSMVTFF